MLGGGGFQQRYTWAQHTVGLSATSLPSAFQRPRVAGDINTDLQSNWVVLQAYNGLVCHSASFGVPAPAGASHNFCGGAWLACNELGCHFASFGAPAPASGCSNFYGCAGYWVVLQMTRHTMGWDATPRPLALQRPRVHQLYEYANSWVVLQIGDIGDLV